ncbi:glycosyltransferase family 2 protein [Streptomyces luteolus]|uniref:Glycosyltransferase n=1 Tax=Streptomyces luteolus TaxID=3043615 RepID=A0ABT6SQ87_9ACTN|nr:glycosyltransferase [Streptomyces sp. B-S-A12]MDI3417515.1 glycosyltransferase [Streptomyces sp. B-S-A12]
MQVNVVTAVHAPHAGLLSHAWQSLLAQSHDDWTWLVQIDGPDSPVQEALTSCGAAYDGRVRIDTNGTSEGPAVTRNVALGRAEAPLVQNLDADDELEPGALSLLARGLEAHPEAGFAVGRARDLLPDGSLVDHTLPVRPGLLPRGALLTDWATDGPGPRRLPVHPAGAMWRRTLLLSLGGWSALRGMEDTGLAMAASAAGPGLLIDEPTLRYRKHPGQTSTAASEFRGGGYSDSPHTAARGAVEQHVRRA